MHGILADALTLDGLKEKFKNEGVRMEAKLIKGIYSVKKGFKRVSSDLPGKADHVKAEMNVLNIYKGIQDQTFDGFGGALTDSSCKVLDGMSDVMRREVLYSYYGDNGIGYKLIRVPMDSCDFSQKQYAAATDWHKGGENEFSFAKEQLLQIKILKEIYDIAGEKIPILLCPWSPLAAMKDNNDRVGGRLLKERYEDYADYICTHIMKLREEGFVVDGITIQNEQNAWQTWDSCLFTKEEEKNFIESAMLPALKEYGLYKVKIYLWDHNKERLIERADCGLKINDPQIAGVAFHWYTGDHFDAVRIAHERYPEHKFIHTEGCVELTRYGNSTDIMNAERYAHDILGDLKNGTNAYYDWNLILDEKGGPNYVDNFCDAPVIYKTGAMNAEYNLSFHYIGMISRYIKQGAIRVETSVYEQDIDNVAFKNPDGTTCLIILNRSDDEKAFCVRFYDEIFEFELEKHSIATLVFK